ncbi:MAG: ATP-binding cassette domain-containing protein [Pseudomonadota bacterium]
MSGLQITWIRHGERGSDARPQLLIKDLVVRVGVRRILEGIELEIFEGDHVRITGANGCGKSTLLNAIAGIAPARIASGQICFKGTDITTWPTHERARLGIAYMRQVDNVFLALSIRENLMMALGQDGYELFTEAFPEWAADFPPDKRVGQLSGGQRKKVAWGMTVLRNAPLILADEPEAGVAQRFVPPATKTYILVTHQ